jgi:hypothetical protein
MPQLLIGRSQTGKVQRGNFLRKAAFRRWVDLPDHRGDPAHRLFPAFMLPDTAGSPPGCGSMGHCIDRHPVEIVKGLLLSMIS